MIEEHPILTVSQLSQAIKLCLEKTFPFIWLQGEISNCKPHSSGHLYFSLKDPHSQIGAVMFRPDVNALKMIPKDGIQVIVKGEINLYPLSGKYQIVVKEMKQVGLGELLLKLEELKIKLNKKGWFRKERKKPLPKFPQKIGVVTSPTGAVIQDMIHILTRRFSGFHLLLNPVKVQGEGAAKEIAQAIQQFNDHHLVDVLIVGRGGGSIEDLWAFNEEIVAEAIFNSKIPIISAVGHETDHCIADYVADIRAPTPSAAAEIVITEKNQHLIHLEQFRKHLQQSLKQTIRKDRQRLIGLIRHPILQSPYGILAPWLERLDTYRLDADSLMKELIKSKKILLHSKQDLLRSLTPRAKLSTFKQKLGSLEKGISDAFERKLQKMEISIFHANNVLHQSWLFRLQSKRTLFHPPQKLKQLDTSIIRLLNQKKERFFQLKDSLDSINPKNLLAKGYCILFSEKDHSIINSIHSLKKEEKLQILLNNGSLQVTINEIIAK